MLEKKLLRQQHLHPSGSRAFPDLAQAYEKLLATDHFRKKRPE